MLVLGYFVSFVNALKAYLYLIGLIKKLKKSKTEKEATETRIKLNMAMDVYEFALTKEQRKHVDKEICALKVK